MQGAILSGDMGIAVWTVDKEAKEVTEEAMKWQQLQCKRLRIQTVSALNSSLPKMTVYFAILL